MRIPLDINLVKKSFEDNGYILLSERYTNAKTKLDYICSKGHKHSITWSDWNSGKYRCPYCAGVSKPTIEQIRKSFEQDGYTLLSKEYINCRTKLIYRCSKGHEHSIVWNGWQQGRRCLTCTGQIKPTLEQIKKSFEQEGYILISKEYINTKTKLYYTCNNNHNNDITWCHWQEGIRCPTCDDIIKSGSGHPSWRGGISYEPYCPIWKDKEYKEDIKIRDGYRCLNPYCYSKKPNYLVIHHIDYNKKNCHPKNLITICNSCNSMANKDRDWHKTWYQAIIKNRYNYGGVKCL